MWSEDKPRPDWWSGALHGIILYMYGRIQRGLGLGFLTPPPLKIYKNIGFISNIGPEQNYQAAFNVGPPSAHQRNGVSLVGRWWPAYSGIWILSPLINLKRKKKLVKVVTWVFGRTFKWLNVVSHVVNDSDSVHDLNTNIIKPSTQHVCPAKTRISLCVCPVFAVHMGRPW